MSFPEFPGTNALHKMATAANVSTMVFTNVLGPVKAGSLDCTAALLVLELAGALALVEGDVVVDAMVVRVPDDDAPEVEGWGVAVGNERDKLVDATAQNDEASASAEDTGAGSPVADADNVEEEKDVQDAMLSKTQSYKAGANALNGYSESVEPESIKAMPLHGRVGVRFETEDVRLLAEAIDVGDGGTVHVSNDLLEAIGY